jgi:hypothetical protein
MRFTNDCQGSAKINPSYTNKKKKNGGGDGAYETLIPVHGGEKLAVRVGHFVLAVVEEAHEEKETVVEDQIAQRRVE